MSTEDMKKLLADAQAKLRLDELKAGWEEQVDEAHRLRVAAIQAAAREKDAERRELLAQVSTLEKALSTALSARAPASPLAVDSGPARPAAAPSNTSTPSGPFANPGALISAPARVFEPVRKLVEDFLTGYAKERKPAMFKKVQPALNLLRELHGTKPVDELRQADLVDYFNVVQGLPPRWEEKCKKRRMFARELASQEHDALLGKKTFDDNYVVPIRLFLKWARYNWQDQGFPVTLTTEGVEFLGEDDEGKNRQRAFTRDELTRLFHEELASFQIDPSNDHKWWLPALALYTGARVNELCQINPQTDIGTSKDGIPYVLITEETEGDERVRKSVKTKIQRYVPLHPELVAGGFMTYAERVAHAGWKLLFPAWAPANSRASTQAEKWFREYLRAKGLRDETPEARIVGFHAFRHTLLARAANSQPPVDAGPITGHADPAKSSVVRGYEGELLLETKLRLLKAIQFGFSPFSRE